MSKAIAAMIGIFLVGHGIITLLFEGNHFLLFNTDVLLDFVHLATGGLLLFVSRERVSGALTSLALWAVAALSILLGAWGLADQHLMGLLPTGLAPGDYAIFFGFGAVAALGAILPHPERPIWHEAPPQPS